MNLLDRIIDCEIKYTALTSTCEDRNSYIKFKDIVSPNLPNQNFIYIKRETPVTTIKNLIKQEKVRLNNGSAGHIRFVFDPLLANSGELAEFSDFTFKSFLVFILDLKKIKTLEADKDCSLLGHYNKKSFKALYYSLNNSIRNIAFINRWIDIKLREPRLQTVVYKANNKLIGSCELFYNEKIAKLEDLEVLEYFRGRGIGISLLKSSVAIAMSKGIDTIYLISENDDKIVDFYMKRGFACYTIYNTCTLYR